MKVLGIDYSLNGTGLALYDGVNVLEKKVFTTIKKDVDKDPNIFIYVPKMSNPMEKIDIIVDLIVNCMGYDYVCMEDHIGRYYNWMDGYGILKYLLRKKKKPYIMVSPTMVKKYAGNGKADKSMMSYFLINDYGFDFDYLGKLANNIVDATWMAILGYKYHTIMLENQKPYETPSRYKILKTLYKKETK